MSEAMTDTGVLMFGLDGEKVVAVAKQHQGNGADRFNKQVAVEWARQGLDIRRAHKDSVEGKAMFEKLYEHIDQRQPELL